MPDALDIIERKESGGRNVPNYKYGPGFTASGNFQMINSTWQRWAKAAGIDISQYPRAIDAPYDVQRKVAAHGFKTEGFQPWVATHGLVGTEDKYNYNPSGASIASGGGGGTGPGVGDTTPAQPPGVITPDGTAPSPAAAPPPPTPPSFAEAFAQAAKPAAQAQAPAPAPLPAPAPVAPAPVAPEQGQAAQLMASLLANRRAKYTPMEQPQGILDAWA